MPEMTETGTPRGEPGGAPDEHLHDTNLLSRSFRDVEYAVKLSETELEDALRHLPESGPVFLEIRCALGARADLGRPTTTPIENRDAFMRFLQTK